MIHVKDEWVLVQNWEVDEDKTQLGIQRLQKEKEISDHKWVSGWALKFRHRCLCAPLQLRSSHNQEKKGKAVRRETMVNSSRQKVLPLQEDHRRFVRRRRGWVK